MEITGEGIRRKAFPCGNTFGFLTFSLLLSFRKPTSYEKYDLKQFISGNLSPIAPFCHIQYGSDTDVQFRAQGCRMLC